MALSDKQEKVVVFTLFSCALALNSVESTDCKVFVKSIAPGEVMVKGSRERKCVSKIGNK